MNFKRYLLAALTAFAFTFVYEGFAHGILLFPSCLETLALAQPGCVLLTPSFLSAEPSKLDVTAKIADVRLCMYTQVISKVGFSQSQKSNF